MPCFIRGEKKPGQLTSSSQPFLSEDQRDPSRIMIRGILLKVLYRLCVSKWGTRNWFPKENVPIHPKIRKIIRHQRKKSTESGYIYYVVDPFDPCLPRLYNGNSNLLQTLRAVAMVSANYKLAEQTPLNTREFYGFLELFLTVVFSTLTYLFLSLH